MTRSEAKTPLEVCILAGGLSTRMGRDKSRVRIKGMTMLARARTLAQTLETAGRRPVRVRVIRKDRVPRCGPLGGILSALLSSRATGILFLACDMPLVSPRLLQRLIERSGNEIRAVFSTHRGLAGFPLVIPVAQAPLVARQIARGELSLQKLAGVLRAVKLRAPAAELFNVNTLHDLALVEK